MSTITKSSEGLTAYCALYYNTGEDKTKEKTLDKVFFFRVVTVKWKKVHKTERTEGGRERERERIEK